MQLIGSIITLSWGKIYKLSQLVFIDGKMTIRDKGGNIDLTREVTCVFVLIAGTSLFLYTILSLKKCS